MENDVIKFLLGEGPLDGIWFGDKHPNERGAFWWRKHLRQYVTQNQAQLQQHGVMQAEDSDSAEGAAVGQRSGGTVAEGMDEDIYIKPIPTAEYKLTISKIEKIERGASGKEQP